MNLLINGAKSVGLKEHYIKWLESIEYYKVPKHILEARNKHIPPTFDGLKEITLEELNKHNTHEDCWVSVMGYVIKCPKDRIMFPGLRGKEISGGRMLNINDISLDDNPQITSGKPPYPLIKEMKPHELEYLQTFHLGKSSAIHVDL